MLNMSRTLMHRTREIPFVPGTQVKEEGVPLVLLLVDGNEAVKGFESGDVAKGAKFAGYSYSETLTPITANQQLTVVTDEDGCVLLPYEPITGQISVYTEDDKGVLARVGSSNVTIDTDNPRKITIKTGSGETASVLKEGRVNIVYKYMPSIETIFWEHRVLIPSVSASALTNSTGVILAGEVWTDKIDLASDFGVATNKLYINADGVLAAAATVPATGIEVPNASIIGIPNANQGFLGIRF